MNRICAVCGGLAPSNKQCSNQDTGYSICPRCWDTAVKHDGLEESLKSYGAPGIHHSTTEKPQLLHLAIIRDFPFAREGTTLCLPNTPETQAALQLFPDLQPHTTPYLDANQKPWLRVHNALPV